MASRQRHRAARWSMHAAALAGTAAVMFSGGAAAQTSSSSPGAAAGVPAGRAAPVADPDGKHPRVAIISFGSFINFFLPVIAGVEKANQLVAPQGGAIDYIAIDQVSQDAINAAVQAAVTQGYDAIGVVALGDGACPAIEQAVAEGVTVATMIGDAACAKDAGALFFHGEDYFNTWRDRVAPEMLRLVGDPACKVGIITGAFAVTAHEARRTGFVAGLEGSNLTPVSDGVEGGTEPSKAAAAARDYVTSTPDLCAILVTVSDNGAAAGALTDEEAAGIKVLSADFSEGSVEQLKSGHQASLFSQDPFGEGYDTAMWLYNHAISGQGPAGGYVQGVQGEFANVDNIDELLAKQESGATDDGAAGGMSDAAFEGRGLTKHYGGVAALRDVSFRIRSGEVVALVGGNGAGKSTLVACCSGARRPDAGTTYIGGKEVVLRSPRDARRAGVAVVHQEPQLLEGQTVAENIYLSRLAERGFVAPRRAAMQREAAALLASLAIVGVAPESPAASLTGAQRQLVEMARALVTEPSVLFLDEPNASLAVDDTERLLGVVRRLTVRGVGVVFVSHRLVELYGVADRVIVLRDGRKVADGSVTGIPMADAVRLMSGEAAPAAEVAALAGTVAIVGPRPDRIVRLPALSRPSAADQPMIELRGLCGVGFSDVSLAIRSGEIVGMTGLVGSGRTEVALATIGAGRVTAGDVLLDGEPVTLRGPGDAIARGIAFVPEDRRSGVFQDQSVAFNLRAGRWGAVDETGPASIEALMAQLSIKASSPHVAAGTLSGGNQQKLLFGRAVSTGPRLLILDEPTHGVDVATKRETYDWMRNLAASGMAIWFISSDVEEIVELSRRVIVMRAGRVVDDVEGAVDVTGVVASSFGHVDAEGWVGTDART